MPDDRDSACTHIHPTGVVDADRLSTVHPRVDEHLTATGTSVAV
ncbi:MAG TPA: hypothetical protein VKY81_09095 [Natronosporangium sp.]|nr:hypothetical protein [Natronosporangium sp.]